MNLEPKTRGFRVFSFFLEMITMSRQGPSPELVDRKLFLAETRALHHSGGVTYRSRNLGLVFFFLCRATQIGIC